MPISKDAKIGLAIGYRLQFEPTQDRHVLLYPEGMVELSDSAWEILSRCAGQLNGDQIVAALADEFDGADLGQDVVNFLDGAHERGWIVST